MRILLLAVLFLTPRITMKREGERLVVRLECEPVVGETNLPNPDLY